MDRYQCCYIGVHLSGPLTVTHSDRCHTFLSRRQDLRDTMAYPAEERPLFSFGLISDVQYADADDGHDYTGTRRRSYRNSLLGLREAVTSWNTSQFPVTFVLQLGDLVDARNKEKGQSKAALAKVLSECRCFKGEFHHIWGNHEFYNFSRTELYDLPLSPAYVEQNPFVFDLAVSDSLKISLPVPGDINNNGGYYSFSPHPDFLFIMLDTYGKSMLGYEPDSPEFKKSEAFLKSMNPNTDLNDPSGLEGVAQRLCMFNGAVDDFQLIWLDNILKGAEDRGQKVVVAGHVPIHPQSCSVESLCWNYTEILSKFHKYGCVLAYLCGHDHPGGQYRDEHGILYLTLPGLVEARPGKEDYGTVHTFKDRMELHGHGRVPNMTLVRW